MKVLVSRIPTLLGDGRASLQDFLHVRNQPRNAHKYTAPSTSYAQAVDKNSETIHDFTLNSIPSQNIDNFCRLEKLIEKQTQIKDVLSLVTIVINKLIYNTSK